MRLLILLSHWEREGPAPTAWESEGLGDAPPRQLRRSARAPLRCDFQRCAGDIPGDLRPDGVGRCGRFLYLPDLVSVVLNVFPPVAKPSRLRFMISTVGSGMRDLF